MASGELPGPARADASAREFQRRLAARDPEAVEIYRRHQESSIGTDPLADGACEWPSELTEPGRTVDVPASAPILGWRMWRVSGSLLLAPFLSRDSPFATPRDRKEPGIAWQRGINKAAAARCGGTAGKATKRGHRPVVHPTARCRCGIRAVQSRTVLAAFAAQMHERLGPTGAIAQVAVWGRVASYSPDDDWRYTLRAQYARIVSRLELDPALERERAALEERYRITG